MTSAIYAARANLKVLLLDENACGGLVNWTKVVENMPSYKSIGGMELVERVQEQVEALGVTVEEAACIDSMDLAGEVKTIEADDEIYTAKAVIVATGRKPAPLEAAGDCEQVHYCAVCDGSAYIGKRVLIVGGGNSGFDEALSLLDLGISELTLIEKMDRFLPLRPRRPCSRSVRTLPCFFPLKLYPSTKVISLILSPFAVLKQAKSSPMKLTVFLFSWASSPEPNLLLTTLSLTLTVT